MYLELHSEKMENVSTDKKQKQKTEGLILLKLDLITYIYFQTDQPLQKC